MLSDLRRHARYFLANSMAAAVDGADATVVDLSLGGTRLQTRQPVAIGANVSFVLRTSAGAICGRATVKWCQLTALALGETDSDTFLAGLAFDETTAALGPILDRLAEGGQAVAIVDNRKTERYHVTAPLLGSYRDESEVRVIDLSVCGARISASATIDAGATGVFRFRLTSGPAVEVRATVVWCHPTEYKPGFDIGLRIDGVEAVMRVAIAQLCMRKHARVDTTSLRHKFELLPLAS